MQHSAKTRSRIRITVQRDENLNRYTASIPSWMFMKTNDRKSPNTGKMHFSLLRAWPLSHPASTVRATRAQAITLLDSYPIKILHWHYRNIASALMNFLRLGYDSLMGAPLQLHQYGGCFDEEIQPFFTVGSSRFPFTLFAVGHAA